MLWLLCITVIEPCAEQSKSFCAFVTRLLGVDQEATFEEVQDARNYLYEVGKQYTVFRISMLAATNAMATGCGPAVQDLGHAPPTPVPECVARSCHHLNTNTVGTVPDSNAVCSMQSNLLIFVDQATACLQL